jgi:nucleoside-diphosphate-sugar epimerase
MSGDEGKETAALPKVLVLGGLGFIGRNLVKYLVDNKLASKIRVCDKSMTVTSWLHPEHATYFAKDAGNGVEIRQCDLARDAHVTKAFADETFDFVVNLTSETRSGLTDQDYELKCVTTAEKAAVAAAEHKAKKFVELSHAQVYAPSKKPSKEDGKLAPWTVQGKYRALAETKVRAVEDLPLVVLRPALVYGPGDRTGLTPRITCAAAYQQLGQKMEFLWGKDMRINAVHVEDVCSAIWAACTQAEPGSTYNLADATNLSQGMLNEHLGKMFGIKTGFVGSIKSNLAKLMLGGVADDANNKHVPAFLKLCRESKIMDTPISPHIHKELLKNNSLCIDGTKITGDLTFSYKYPVVTEALLRQQVQFFIDQGIFAPCLK